MATWLRFSQTKTAQSSSGPSLSIQLYMSPAELRNLWDYDGQIQGVDALRPNQLCWVWATEWMDHPKWEVWEQALAPRNETHVKPTWSIL